MKILQKYTFWLFLIDEIDINQILSVLWTEVIAGQKLAPMCDFLIRLRARFSTACPESLP